MQALRGTHTQRVDLGTTKVFHLKNWDSMGDPRKLQVISEIIDSYGRDPRIAEQAVAILRQSGIAPRDYTGQQAALLAWVQNNIYYVNEPGERLQAPLWTLEKKFGDCDDMIILLLSFYHTLGFPWKLVISGVSPKGQKQRYIQGQKRIPKGNWTHIYGMVGDQPFNPNKWHFVEPTLQGAPFGWDVVAAKGNVLPEMQGAMAGFGASSMGAGIGTGIGIGVGTGAAAHHQEGSQHYLREVLTAVVIAVVSSVATELWLENIRKKRKGSKNGKKKRSKKKSSTPHWFSF